MDKNRKRRILNMNQLDTKEQKTNVKKNFLSP
jgi:hypothetical protein